MKYFLEKAAAIILSFIMISAMMPVMIFAEDNVSDEDLTGTLELYEDEACGEAETGHDELVSSTGIDAADLKGADPDQLIQNFLLSEIKTSAAGSLSGKMTPKAPLSVKGSRLTGKNLKYYNYYKEIIKAVVAGKKSATTKKVSLSKLLGKRKFTAKELGVKKIGYKKNGKWHVTSEAEKKIQNMLSPEDWRKVYQGILSDMSSDSYWVDWYGDSRFFSWNCPYTYDSNTLYFDKSAWIEFSLPVIPEFAKARNAVSNYIYKTDINKIKGADAARNNAKRIVETFDSNIPTTFAGYSPEAIDFYRLWYYCSVIAQLNTYDTYSATLPENERYWLGPWSLIYVFDDSASTNAVCAGYARAFKYLCDLSTFESDWIDCQIVSGSAGGADTSHMWNIVRMNDGLNYVVDPTWIDDDVNGTPDDAWFLRGTQYGSADSFMIEGNFRTYDDWTKSVYAPAERVLSKKDYYELTSNRPIILKETNIKKLYSKKKAFKVSWNKMSTSLGALYIDGYQIQYSTNKSFKNARNVKIKGYAKTKKTIKNLKSKKTYYVRIRTYAKVGRKTYYSEWSGRKKIRTK